MNDTLDMDASRCDEFAEVESSNLLAAGVRGRDLIVWFKGGVAYEYPEAGELFHALVASESKGRFFNAKVRRVPGYRRLCTVGGCLEPSLPNSKVCAAHEKSRG